MAFCFQVCFFFIRGVRFFGPLPIFILILLFPLRFFLHFSGDEWGYFLRIQPHCAHSIAPTTPPVTFLPLFWCGYCMMKQLFMVSDFLNRSVTREEKRFFDIFCSGPSNIRKVCRRVNFVRHKKNTNSIEWLRVPIPPLKNISSSTDVKTQWACLICMVCHFIH